MIPRDRVSITFRATIGRCLDNSLHTQQHNRCTIQSQHLLQRKKKTLYLSLYRCEIAIAISQLNADAYPLAGATWRPVLAADDF